MKDLNLANVGCESSYLICPAPEFEISPFFVSVLRAQVGDVMTYGVTRSPQEILERRVYTG